MHAIINYYTHDIIIGPLDYNAARFKDVITRFSGDPEFVPETAPETAVTCGPLVIVPAYEERPEPPGPVGYSANPGPWVVAEDGASITCTVEYVQLPVALIKSELKRQLTDIRFNHETAGLEMADGRRILTDRASQGMITQAVVTLERGTVKEADFKAASGWVTATIDVIGPIADAVGEHVQQAFSAERRVSETVIDPLDDADALLALDLRAAFNQALADIAEATPA